jgi:hypothetical protein
MVKKQFGPIFYVRGYGIFIQATRLTPSKIFWFPVWHLRLARFVRGLFPAFYAVGMHCCDHGGQVRSFRPVAVFGEWHRSKIDDYGDGPDSWSQMSLLTFVKWRLWLRSHGIWSEHVDGPRFHEDMQK